MADNQPGLQNSTTLGGADGVTGIFPPPLLREPAPPAKLLREYAPPAKLLRESAPPAKLLREPAPPAKLLQEGHKQANIPPGHQGGNDARRQHEHRHHRIAERLVKRSDPPRYKLSSVDTYIVPNPP